MRAQHREFAAPLLGGRVVVAVQHDGVAACAPVGQPLDGARVAVEPVVTGQAGGHQQRHRHLAGIHLCAERLDVGQGAFPYPRDRDDQFSRHTCSLPIPDVGTVKDTQTAGVYPTRTRREQTQNPRFGRPNWADLRLLANHAPGQQTRYQRRPGNRFDMLSNAMDKARSAAAETPLPTAPTRQRGRG